jgi:hypothetical protein
MLRQVCGDMPRYFDGCIALVRFWFDPVKNLGRQETPKLFIMHSKFDSAQGLYAKKWVTVVFTFFTNSRYYFGKSCGRLNFSDQIIGRC